MMDDHLGFGCYSSCRLLQVARKPPGFGFIDFDDPRDANTCQYRLSSSSVGASVPAVVVVAVSSSSSSDSRKKLHNFQVLYVDLAALVAAQ
eukprot:6971-Heterococcus_DN1.PRE.1